MRLELPETASDADQERAVGVCDGEGRVSFADLRWGDLRITATAAEHFAGYFDPAPLVATEQRHVRIWLHPVLRVRGRVVRAADGAPLAGARVHWRDRPPDGLHDEEYGENFEDGEPAATDAEGRFLLDGLRMRRDYGIWAEVTGYECGERPLYLSHPGSAPEVVLALRAAGTCVARVLDHMGKPVADWQVVLVPEEVMLRREAEAEAEARARAAPRVERAESSPDPLELELRSLEINLRPGSWFGPGTHPIYSARTDPQGVAHVEGLAFGRAFRVVPPQRDWLGRTPWRAAWGDDPLRVEATSAVPHVALELRVVAEAALHVSVLDEGGVALAARPHVRVNDSLNLLSQEADHQVLAKGLLPGVASLRVEAEGCAPQTLEVELQPGETRRVEVRMRPGGVLRGIVVDAAGQPFTSGRVSQVGVAGAPAELDERGGFEIVGLAPGAVTLLVEAEDADEAATHQVRAPADNLRLTLPRGQRGSVVARTAPIARVDAEPAEAPVPFVSGDADDALAWPTVLPAASVDGPDVGWRWSVRPGTYVVCASHEECVVIRRTVEVVAGRESDLGLLVPELSPPVEGDVLHADGTPAPHARLRFRGHAFVIADGAGRFRLAHRPSGPVPVLVGGGDLVARESLEAPPAVGQRWLLRASLGGVLEGRVPAGSSPDTLALRIEPIADGARPPREVPRIDTAGCFRLRLAPGRYRVTLLRGADLLDDIEVRIEEGRPVDLALGSAR